MGFKWQRCRKALLEHCLGIFIVIKNCKVGISLVFRDLCGLFVPVWLSTISGSLSWESPEGLGLHSYQSSERQMEKGRGFDAEWVWWLISKSKSSLETCSGVFCKNFASLAFQAANRWNRALDQVCDRQEPWLYDCWLFSV